MRSRDISHERNCCPDKESTNCWIPGMFKLNLVAEMTSDRLSWNSRNSLDIKCTRTMSRLLESLQALEESTGKLNTPNAVWNLNLTVLNV